MSHPIVRMFHDEIRQIVDNFSDQRLENQHQSIVVILRGLPGAGKSIFATLLKIYAEGIGLETQICSADDYFHTLHGYRYDPDQLTAAHLRCEAYCDEALRRGVPVVVIDNTNVTPREWMRYVNLARRDGHAVCRVNITGDLTPAQLLTRTARVSDEAVITRRIPAFNELRKVYAPHHEVIMRTDAFTAQVDVQVDLMHPMELMFFNAVAEQLQDFVQFRKTANPLDTQKSLVFVLRGLPGCGKTTFALQTKVYASALGLKALICSSDDFYRSRYGFRFDPAFLDTARNANLISLRFALFRHVDVVVVDNANITEDEWRPTLFQASLHHVVVVNFVCPSLGLAREQLARTFTHCAPVDAERLESDFAAFHDAQLPAHIDIDPVFNAWDPIVAETNRATQRVFRRAA